MTATHIALLPDRGVVAVTGADARKAAAGADHQRMDRLESAATRSTPGC